MAAGLGCDPPGQQTPPSPPPSVEVAPRTPAIPSATTAASSAGSAEPWRNWHAPFLASAAAEGRLTVWDRVSGERIDG